MAKAYRGAQCDRCPRYQHGMKVYREHEAAPFEYVCDRCYSLLRGAYFGERPGDRRCPNGHTIPEESTRPHSFWQYCPECQAAPKPERREGAVAQRSGSARPRRPAPQSAPPESSIPLPMAQAQPEPEALHQGRLL